MSTKKCPQCAETVGADAFKCEFCGAELSTQEKSAVQDKLNRGKKTIGSLVNNLTSFENKGMFDPKIALLLSVLFTPIFGAYFNHKAWKEIGDAPQIKQAKYSLIASVVSTILCFILLPFWAYIVFTVAAICGLFIFQTKKLQKAIAEKECSIDKNIKIWIKPVIIAVIPILLVGIISIICCEGEPASVPSSKISYTMREEGDNEIYTYRSKDNNKPFTGKIRIFGKQDFPAGSEMADRGTLEVRNGLLHGEVITFYPPASTTRRYKEHYKNGKLDGECIYFNIHGKLERCEIYKDGRAIDTKHYDENKVLRTHIFVSDKGTETIQYTADKKVESHICKDKKGKETGFYHKFRDEKVYEKEELLPNRTRRVITYYDNGKVESDYHYKDSGTFQYKHGRCINYNEDGSVAKEEVYNKGKLQK